VSGWGPAPDPAHEDDDPVRRFAGRLRELRVRAGSPPFRELARLTHYGSSTLAEATAGRRLPTEAVVTAFVVACGERPGPWLAELRRAAEEAARRPEGGDRGEAVGGGAGSGAGAGSGGGGADAGGAPDGGAVPVAAESGRAPAGRRSGRRRAALLGAGALLVVAGGAAGAGVEAAAHPAAPVSAAHAVRAPFTDIPSAEPTARVRDGVDPAAAGCAKGSQLTDKAPVMLGGAQIGALEIHYSPHCGAAWARAYLYPARPTMMAEVTLTAMDGRSMSISEPMIRQVPVYTDMLVPGRHGCLGARVVVLAPGRRTVAASIPCEDPAHTAQGAIGHG
jgi:hypothetical protein